jgi:hypothetical protein
MSFVMAFPLPLVGSGIGPLQPSQDSVAHVKVVV